jgi:hypothetical protein
MFEQVAGDLYKPQCLFYIQPGLLVAQNCLIVFKRKAVSALCVKTDLLHIINYKFYS